MPRPEAKPLKLRVEAVKLYTNGLSLRQTATNLNVSSSTIQRWLDQACVRLRDKSTAGILRNPPKSNHWRSSRQSSRKIIERHLGVKLSFNEVVHHKDEDYTNRELSNLEVMPRPKHSKMHNLGNTYTPRKAKCINGHKLEGDNVREFYRKDHNRVERTCRACAREWMRRKRANG